jgi:hypothetical protein
MMELTIVGGSISVVTCHYYISANNMPGEGSRRYCACHAEFVLIEHLVISLSQISGAVVHVYIGLLCLVLIFFDEKMRQVSNNIQMNSLLGQRSINNFL